MAVIEDAERGNTSYFPCEEEVSRQSQWLRAFESDRSLASFDQMIDSEQNQSTYQGHKKAG
jgi:hypothetical protein